jgi:hypothetical protein
MRDAMALVGDTVTKLLITAPATATVSCECAVVVREPVNVFVAVAVPDWLKTVDIGGGAANRY